MVASQMVELSNRKLQPLRLAAWHAAWNAALRFWVVMVCFFLVSNRAECQIEKLLEEAGVVGSILDEKVPFDLITLKKEAGGKTVRVNPITDFPDRKVPANPKETDRFTVTFPFFPNRTYEILWRDVEAVYLYEQLILNNANKLLESKQFGEAFEHLNFLIDHFPQTPGIARIRRDFLYRSAIEMATSRKYAHALAVLEQFQREFPDDPEKERIRNAISNVSSQLVESYFSNNDLASAKALIARLDSDYKKDPVPVVEKWNGKFTELAKDLVQQSRDAYQGGEFVRARSLVSKALEIDGKLDGAKELLSEIVRNYNIVRVAVFETSSRADPSALANWSAYRNGQLTQRPLFEFRNTGPEGGIYRFTFGSYQHSDDRTELDLMIQSSGKDGLPDSLELSKSFLDRAEIGNKEYSATWAALVDSVIVTGPERLKIKFRQPHVLPYAFLQWPLSRSAEELKANPLAFYQLFSNENGLKRFQWASRTKPPVEFQPIEIHEIKYDDPQKAIADLKRGEVEIIDRLFPADVQLLKNAKNVAIDEYALPMVHMLIPRTSNAYLDMIEFRRALLFAINREGILAGEILGNSDSSASRVISGPFPYGTNEATPLAYAYNVGIENIPYDPRSAKVLVMLAKSKLKAIADKKGEAIPPIPTLRLGVPDSETARVAGEAMIQAWKLIEQPAELVVLNGETNQNVDLVYVSASIWEPATDAERLFGKGGPAESNNQFIVQALNKLSFARNWREVRSACQELHALVAAHLPILPLWQVNESFAYRTEITGISKKPIGIYQDVQKWRFQPK